MTPFPVDGNQYLLGHPLKLFNCHEYGLTVIENSVIRPSNLCEFFARRLGASLHRFLQLAWSLWMLLKEHFHVFQVVKRVMLVER